MPGKLFAKLCDSSLLYHSWLEVKRKGSSGGIDGRSIEEFESNLSENLKGIKSELQQKNWSPEPYLRIHIPKKDGELRKLGMLTIRDKIVQCAIRTLVEPRFEKMFVANSYGYRPNKGHNKAIKFARHCCSQKGVSYILRLDIDNYFDTINHELLFKRIAPVVADDEVLRLIALCVKMGVVGRNLKWEDSEVGVPQGAVLSPMLSNFYLHSFDQFVLTRTDAYVRYADDFIICCKTQEEAELLLSECREFLEKRLLLKLNTPSITALNNGFEFLGILFNDKGVGLSDDKELDLFQRIRNLQWGGDGFVESTIEEFNGIHTYYVKIIPQDILIRLDNELISHLNTLVKKNFSEIRSKKVLQTAMRNIVFFTDSNNIRKKEVINSLLVLYSQLKSKGRAELDKEKNKKVIEKRKREYRKRENDTRELVIGTFGTFLGIGKKGITIKHFGKQKMVAAANNVKHISILSDGISISSNLVGFCYRKDITIDFFSSNGQHVGSVLSNAYMRNSLWFKQAGMTLERKAYLAKRIIYGKIKNQTNLLKYFSKYRRGMTPELEEKFDSVIPKLKKLSNCVKQQDETDPEYRQKLMGFESSSAVLYWSYIRELLSDDGVRFEKREHQGATDLFNSLLNYGYGILYSRIWQYVLRYQMNPMSGVLHVEQNSKPVFVYDIVELFRSQCVDRVVVGLIQKGEPLEIKDGLLTQDTRKLLIHNVLERINRYEVYRAKEMLFSDIMKEQIREIADYIENGKTYKPYIAKW